MSIGTKHVRFALNTLWVAALLFAVLGAFSHYSAFALPWIWVVDGENEDASSQAPGCVPPGIASKWQAPPSNAQILAVGAPGANDKQGEVRFYKKDGSLVYTLRQPDLPPSPLMFGSALVEAGDVDHDGIPDLLIGAGGTPGYPGQVYLKGSRIRLSPLPLFTMSELVAGDIRSVAVGNIDNDSAGALEIVGVHAPSRTIVVGFLDAHGSPSARSPNPLELPCIYSYGVPREVLLEDVDGDTYPEIVVTLVDGSDSGIVVYKNVDDGSGGRTYQSGTLYRGAQSNPPIPAPMSTLYGLRAIHLDSNTSVDFLAADPASNSFFTFQNTGSGAFTSGRFYSVGASVSGQVYSTLVGDFDGVQGSDIIAGFSGGPTQPAIALFANNGNGGFSSAIPLYTLGAGADPVKIEDVLRDDLNGDGHSDLILSDTQNSRVISLVNDGHGAYIPTVLETAVATSGVLRRIAIADLNRDTVPDLAISTATNANTYMGMGDGTFSNPGVLGYPLDEGSQLVPADVNHDGLLDIIAGSRDGTEANLARITLLKGDLATTQFAGVLTENVAVEGLKVPVRGYGADDFLIGLPATGVVRLCSFMSSFNCPVSYPSEPKYDQLGFSLASMRTFGYGDPKKAWFVAGAPGAAGSPGKAYLFSYTRTQSGFAIEQEFQGTGVGRFGWAVANVGNMNLDMQNGRDKFAVSSPWGTSSSPPFVAVYTCPNVLDAGSTAIETDPPCTLLGTLEGKDPDEAFGYSLAGIGDTNGNGKPELAIGAPRFNAGQGKVYIVEYTPSSGLTVVGEKLGQAIGESLGLKVAGRTDSSKCEFTSDSYSDFFCEH